MFLTSTLHFQSEGDFEMTTLLRSNMKNILNLLLLHLSTHRERVLAGIGIKMLAKMNQLAGEEKPLQMDSEKADGELALSLLCHQWKWRRSESEEISFIANIICESCTKLFTTFHQTTLIANIHL